MESFYVGRVAELTHSVVPEIQSTAHQAAQDEAPQ